MRGQTPTQATAGAIGIDAVHLPRNACDKMITLKEIA
jgi:hypothetical protein